MFSLDQRQKSLLTGTLATFFLFALQAPGTVESHPNHGPSLGERYFKLDVRDDRVRVVYGLTYAARHGGRVRGDADANGDGHLDESEAQSFGEGYRSKLSTSVSLRVDGQPEQLSWSTPFLGQVIGPLGPGIVAIEMTSEIELTPGAHTLVLDDRAEFTGIFRTTAMTSIAPEVELTKAGRGEAPRGRERRVVYMDLPSPGEPPSRVFSVEAVLPGEPEVSEEPPIASYLLLGGLVIILLVVGFGGYRVVSARGRGNPER